MKRIIFSTFITLIIAILLSSCGSTRKNAEYLTHNSWRLKKVILVNDNHTEIPPADVTILFSDTSTVSGRGGCNSFFGIYKTEGYDRINIEIIGTTLAECPHMEFEQRYMTMLGLVDKYRARRNRLQLNDVQNNVILVYKPMFK